MMGADDMMKISCHKFGKPILYLFFFILCFVVLIGASTIALLIWRKSVNYPPPPEEIEESSVISFVNASTRADSDSFYIFKGRQIEKGFTSLVSVFDENRLKLEDLIVKIPKIYIDKEFTGDSMRCSIDSDVVIYLNNKRMILLDVRDFVIESDSGNGSNVSVFSGYISPKKILNTNSPSVDAAAYAFFVDTGGRGVRLCLKDIKFIRNTKRKIKSTSAISIYASNMLIEVEYSDD